MMKFLKKKSLILSCMICLLPIAGGVMLWNRLPDTMAIHFNMYNEADHFASKGFVVFVLPVLMTLLQIYCCLINDINSAKHGERKKFGTVTKAIIPVLSVCLQTATLGYGLGWNLDMRKIAALLVGLMLIVLGNYLPKFEEIRDEAADTEAIRNVHRMIGIATVVMGILFLISIFLPPVATVSSLFLLIPYAVLCIGYGIKTGRKKQ